MLNVGLYAAADSDFYLGISLVAFLGRNLSSSLIGIILYPGNASGWSAASGWSLPDLISLSIKALLALYDFSRNSYIL
ncbi:hypothetical protein D3C85_1846070 [compost metagenome]